MTGTELATLIRYKTTTNSVTFTDTDMLPLVNLFIKELSSMVVELNVGYFLVPTTFDLIASSTSREYAFPDDMLNRMQKLELKFASGDSRFPAYFIKDYNGSETESEIVKNYSNAQGEFAYVIRRRAILILSGTIVAVTGGGRLWYHAYPSDLTNLTGSTDLSVDPSTTTFGFPRQLHELLARRISIEYKGSRPKPIPLNRMELNYERDLKVQLDAMSTIDNSAEVIGENIPEQELGNSGWDY